MSDGESTQGQEQTPAPVADTPTYPGGGGNDGLAGAPTPDELARRKLDHEGDTKAINEMLVPDGRYSTTKASVREYTSKGANGQDNRISFGVDAGLVNARDIKLDNGQVLPAGTYEDEISFTYSHERRDVQEGEKAGQPDNAYQRYLQVKAAYKQVMQTEPTMVDDLKTFIEGYPLSLRISRFNGRNFIHDIGPVRVRV